ncbi:MAG TPA: guanylate kinase [Polyangiaceae bacterium]|jgi:guanylate kinase|nr:guanylate kinase [Polyangiaceae bacterium]
MSNDGPLLLIVSSPSGAGKTTLTTALQDKVPNLLFSVSHTTRKPRAKEVHGKEYYFVDRPEFEELVREGTFLEWAVVHDNLYGTSLAEIERARSARGLIFDVDHQGARQIKSTRPDAVAVFILPPSMPALLERLHGRASDDEATVNRRYKVAVQEIQHYGLFDYVLVNDNLDDAIEKLTSIFRAEECRRQRAARKAELLIAEGRGYGGMMPR